MVVQFGMLLKSAAIFLLFPGLLSLGTAKFSSAQTSLNADSSAKVDITLNGVITGKQNNTYVEVPFRVPDGVQRVTIQFSYTERDQKTALDLGLRDPDELRCWSGGNKSILTVGITDATPSCLPGPIPSGKWNLLIGVPNIRPSVVSHYTATVFLTYTGKVADEPQILREPLRPGPGWYRGDLHMHTGHSDGRCPNQTGQMVPCPVFVTVDAATRRGLDFIAITDHNAMSQYDAMRELQPYFDKLLLVPGREITTFQGHLNIFGTTQYLDFRLGSKAVPNMKTLLGNAKKLGALISINHPNSPGGEICMGCRWTPEALFNMQVVDAVEAVNGGGSDPEHSGIPFWEEQLNQGHRLTAVGGSDNHQPMLPLDKPHSVGYPTTVVYAQNLSTPAILAGIRSGRVFLDVTGSHDRMIDMQAQSSSSTAVMGGELTASTGQPIAIEAHIVACAGAKAHLIVNGKELTTAPAQTLDNGDQTLRWQWNSDATRGWFLIEVRDPAGQLLLLSNPVYVNWESSPRATP
jgi:hypothetical protein